MHEGAATYYQSTARPQVPAERDAAAAAAETFAKDCVAETGVAEADLPYFATKQAMEDLEAVRDYLGVDKMDLYGLSYGTQFVQTYAAAHPDRIATLYVDGPVDLTIDGPTYYVEATRSAEDTLVAVLDACTADETCTRDMKGGDALAAYDALATTLQAGPITFDFTKSDGTVESRTITDGDLETAAFNALYTRTTGCSSSARSGRRRAAITCRSRARSTARSASTPTPSSRRPTRATRTRSTTPSSARTTRSSPTRAIRTPGSTPGSTAPRRTASTTPGWRPPTTATCPASTGPRRRPTRPGPRR